MAVQVSYPGVYIDEFQPAAPIQGVSTSVAAFIGLNAFGPPNKPTLVTSWDEFLRLFAAPPPTPPEDDDYLWYAVRAFFANGGRICYVTALSNAKSDSFTLRDIRSAANGGPQPTVQITARTPGVLATPIEIKSVAKSVVSAARVYALSEPVAPDPAAGDRKLAVVNAGFFLAGDALVIRGAGNNPPSEPVTVAYTEAGVVHLTAPLVAGYTNATLRFAPPGKTIRVAGAADATGPSSLVVGSVVTFTQAGAGAPPPLTTVVTGVRSELVAGNPTWRVSLRDALTGFTNDPTRAIAIVSAEFTLTVQQGTPQPKIYPDLSMEPAHPRYFQKVIDADGSGVITAVPVTVPTPNNTGPPANRPVQAAFVLLAGGANLDPSAITVNDYDKVLAQLKPINDVSIVAIPGCTVKAVQQAVLAHCAQQYDRVAVFDSLRGADLTAIQDQKASLEDNKGFGALYYPWLETTSVKTGASLLQPPSGSRRRHLSRAPISTVACTRRRPE